MGPTSKGVEVWRRTRAAEHERHATTEGKGRDGRGVTEKRGKEICRT